MKKIFCLIFLFGVMQNSFAKDGWSMSYWNTTQNIGYGGPGFFNINVIANFGDTINFHAYATCGCCMYLAPMQWNFNAVLIPNTADSFYVYVIANQTGTYTAHLDFCNTILLDLNFYVSVNNTTGIPSLKNINFLNVFPTAVNSSITIQLNSIKTNDIEISFFDMNGRQLKNNFYKNVIGEFIKNENTEALAKGIYFLIIKAGDDVVEKKFVKM